MTTSCSCSTVDVGAAVQDRSRHGWYPGVDPQSGQVHDTGLYGSFEKYIAHARDVVENDLQQTWEVRGLIWHQGESDSDGDSLAYGRDLRNLFWRFRKLLSGDLPIIAGQIRELDDGDRALNRTLEGLAAEDPRLVIVSTQDLSFEPDNNGTPNVHIALTGCHELGRRMAAASRTSVGRRLAIVESHRHLEAVRFPGRHSRQDQLAEWSTLPRAARIASTSYTQPPHVPPPSCCSAAHSRVSSGNRGSGARSAWLGRLASNCSALSATRFTEPASLTRSTMTSITSPSCTLPMGPPARASGPTCPMQAPVLTPENRASVRIVTCLPHFDEFQGGSQLVGFFHAGSDRARNPSSTNVAGRDPRPFSLPFDRGDGRRFGCEYSGRPRMAKHAVASNTEGSMAVALMTEPSGHRFPIGNTTVLVSPRCLATWGGMMTSSGSTPSRSLSSSRNACRRGLTATRPESRASLADDGQASPSRTPSSRRCHMISGTPPAKYSWTVG